VFDKNYYAKNRPVWGGTDYAKQLGDVGLLEPDLLRIMAFCLLIGLSFGLAVLIALRFKR
ncbi:MAG: copper oxidase, partial [Methylobacter sp.]